MNTLTKLISQEYPQSTKKLINGDAYNVRIEILIKPVMMLA